MKKILVILFLILTSVSGFSESISDSLIRVSREKAPVVKNQVQNMIKTYKDNQSEHIQKDMDTISDCIDTITNISKMEIKKYGIKGFIQINKDLFLAAAILLILSLIWLKSKKKI
jgi:hypothetical protein